VKKWIIFVDLRNVARERASEAAAVIGLEWMCWASRRWCGAEDEGGEACMDVSKEELPGA
jgi:hypothetical protein